VGVADNPHTLVVAQERLRISIFRL
jgi:hypothetical protein